MCAPQPNNISTRFLVVLVLLSTRLLIPQGSLAMKPTFGAPITHGVMVGDVTSTSAVIWARTNKAATMHVRLKSKHGFGKPIRKHITVDLTRDFTGKVRVKGLVPDTQYRYVVWFGNDNTFFRSHRSDGATSGTFRTAPKANELQSVSFAWGGDVAGQNVCRDQQEGFPIFKAINTLDLDFFIGLGDMIYADGVCESVGRYQNAQIPGDFVKSADLPNFWAHWKYSREDQQFQKLLSHVPYYAVWDDHEVVNDFGPLHDTRDTPPYTSGQHLLPIGLQAFLAYNPIAEKKLTPERLYRHVRWGKHLDLFFLDNRQYRDANLEEDRLEFKKTMLGREQLHWLKKKLQASNATWRVIVSSVPISIPTGFPPELGRDGWANFDQDTGFEHELGEILETLQKQTRRNVVFITTDVHFGGVFRYTPSLADFGFQIHEFVTGPMNAGLFPNRDFDDSLGAESLFFYGPESAEAVSTWEEAKPWLNFGHVEVDLQGNLTVSIRNVEGNRVFETTLLPN